jgi:hypothetical protein
MQQYVLWDAELGKILMGPQGEPGDTGTWVAYAEGPEVINPRTQTREFVYVEEIDTVLGYVVGEPELTWEQLRRANYAPLEDQLDMLWHDINNGTLDKDGAFYAHIKAVKDGAPKGD